MSSNYPAGVTDNHPHFNPPRVSANAVECGSDSALVVPSYVIKADLFDLSELLRQMKNFPDSMKDFDKIEERVAKIRERIYGLEQETEYECPFNDEIDLEESECARWDCPVCGNERETDTMPEERDPDYEHDHMGEGR